MEKRKFRTTWKRNQKYGDDRYQIGKIVGISNGMGIDKNEKGLSYGIKVTDDERGIIVYCTEEDYEKFKKIVEEYILFKCDFDV